MVDVARFGHLVCKRTGRRVELALRGRMLLILLLLLMLHMMVEIAPAGCRRPRARSSCIFDQYFVVTR